MNTQPKPTGEPDCISCGRPPHPDYYGHSYRPREPKPTGDVIERLRYIAESPSSEHGGFHEHAIQTAKDAIFALGNLSALLKAYEQQLASEQEKFQKAKEWNRITELEVNNLRSLLNEIDPDISRKIIAELRQQLDGERGKRMEEGAEFSNISARAIQLQEKVQTLVDALKLLTEKGPLVDYTAIARTALSKVGK